VLFAPAAAPPAFMSGDDVPVPVEPPRPVVVPLPVAAPLDVVPVAPVVPPVAPPLCAKVAETLVSASAVASPNVANFIVVSLSSADVGQRTERAIVPVLAQTLMWR